MSKGGHVFKLLVPKELCSTLSIICGSHSGHPAITVEQLERPNAEIVYNLFSNLASFCYATDVPSHKAQITQGIEHGEIFDDALDMLFTFALSRQILSINHFEDFGLKDIWEPQAKRLRAALSASINFCRYKEAQIQKLQDMRADLNDLNHQRMDLVDKSQSLQDELTAAQTTHNEELPLMFQAEAEEQEAKAIVDKLQKQKQVADRVLEDAEKDLNVKKENLAEKDRRLDQLRKTVQSLKDQIADSPEGLEAEISELKISVRQSKARLDERTDERKSRSQRVQAMRKLHNTTAGYVEDLEKEAEASARCTIACQRSQRCKEELVGIQKEVEARREEETELDQGVRAITEEMENAKQAFQERLQELEERRQVAQKQQQELQAQRSEEQKKTFAMQERRQELESEVAQEIRRGEAKEQELKDMRRQVYEELVAYTQAVDSLLGRNDSEGAGAGGSSKGYPMMSPIPASKQNQARGGRPSRSPSPHASLTPSRGLAGTGMGRMAGRSLFASPNFHAP